MSVLIRSAVFFRNAAQKCRSEVSIASVDEKHGSEVLLRTVDRGVGQRCRSAVWNQQCCSEVCVCVSEVLFRSVAQRC